MEETEPPSIRGALVEKVVEAARALRSIRAQHREQAGSWARGLATGERSRFDPVAAFHRQTEGSAALDRAVEELDSYDARMERGYTGDGEWLTRSCPTCLALPGEVCSIIGGADGGDARAVPHIQRRHP
jgi:hypothetical protein